MEQHPIPQHIASFQFKLFGNLTTRQFITLAIPMALALVVFFSDLATIIRLPIAVIIGLFAIFAALVPIQGRPFDKWAIAFIQAILTPTQRVWIKEQRLPEFLNIVFTSSFLREPPPEEVSSQGRQKLIEYLRSLPKEKSASPLDIKEEIALGHLAFTPLTPQEGKPSAPIIWPTTVSAPQPIEASLPQTAAPPTTPAPAPVPKPQPAPIQPRVTPHAKPFTLPVIEKKLRAGNRIAPITHLASETNFAKEVVIPITTWDNQIHLIHGVGNTRVRKLHFAPPDGFDLSKLPIRGEKRFELSGELKRRFGITDSEADKIFQEQKPQASQAPQVEVTKFPRQTHPIPKPAATVKSRQPPTAPHKAEKLKISNYQVAVTTKKPAVPLPDSQLAKAEIIPLTNKPNFISGIVTLSDGTPLEGTILVVRDQNGIPLRALKTNKLGQFLSATPLANGIYTIEVESDFAEFKPMTLNIEGRVLAPLEIKAQARTHA